MLFEILELIEAGACRRESSTISPGFTRGAKSQAHCLFHGFGLLGDLRTQFRQFPAITTKAVETDVIAGEICFREVKSADFTVATQQQMQSTFHLQTIQRGLCTATYVGGFGIIDPAYAVMLQRQLETVRQTRKRWSAPAGWRSVADRRHPPAPAPPALV